MNISSERNRSETAAGFEAIAVGYIVSFPEDLANIESPFEVHDALCARCPLDVEKKNPKGKGHGNL
jgi:hypothetical protein